MNNATKFEQRASSSRCMHVGESSRDLCDRLSRTRDTSQRQLPTDHDYAASTREYQTDQSSLKPAPTAAGSVLDKRKKQRQQQKQPRGFAGVDRVTPYQVSDRLKRTVPVPIHSPFFWRIGGKPPKPKVQTHAVRGLAARSCLLFPASYSLFPALLISIEIS